MSFLWKVGSVRNCDQIVHCPWARQCNEIMKQMKFVGSRLRITDVGNLCRGLRD